MVRECIERHISNHDLYVLNVAENSERAILHSLAYKVRRNGGAS
jgi:hypothetical protein